MVRATALPACIAVVFAMTAACSQDKPEGFQRMCDHISAADSAVQKHDFADARDEIQQAFGWSEAAVEDTGGADRNAVDAVISSLIRADGDPSADATARALTDAADKCS